MERPRVRFRLRTLMLVIAVLALGMGLARIHPFLVVFYTLAVVAVPVLRSSRRHGPDSRPGKEGVGPAYVYLAGVVGPTLCLVFDPVVFQGGDEHGPILLAYRVAGYSFMALEMALLTLILLAGRSLSGYSALLSGALWVGAAYATLLGLALLPLSLVGMLAIIGVLGLTPFLTAHAFFVEGRRAADLASTRFPARRLLVQQLAGALLAAGLPLLVHWTVRALRL